MSERQKILEMLASGKISVDEAEKLLSAVGDKPEAQTAVEPVAAVAKGRPRYLRVLVSGDKDEKVDVRIPFQLIRAGIGLKSLIPQHAQTRIDESLHEKGVSFSLSDVKPETIDQLIDSLGEFSVDVSGDKGENVRVFCE